MSQGSTKDTETLTHISISDHILASTTAALTGGDMFSLFIPISLLNLNLKKSDKVRCIRQLEQLNLNDDYIFTFLDFSHLHFVIAK